MFLDLATLQLESGKGGDGCVSTRKEKYVPRGGPDGGNGGKGGSVILEATSELSTLLDFKFKRKYKAGNGQPGGGQRCTGADGQDVVLKVPCGTVVYNEDDDRVLGELLEDGQRLLIVRGGKGGKGNWEFRNARNQTPMFAQPGQEGRALQVRLELKLIADIGLVGMPNAGKSTLLSVVTAARPKVADYPFTTLVPNLGIVDLGDYRGCTLADIPGLIEGASEGRGLGHEFLRHIERTRALLMLVDPVLDDPCATLDVLRGELANYGQRLAELPFAVAVTKRDLLDDEAAAEVLEQVRAWSERNGARATIHFSSVSGQGMTDLRRLLQQLYDLRQSGD